MFEQAAAIGDDDGEQTLAIRRGRKDENGLRHTDKRVRS
jgi:hypothetical protein